MIQLNVILLSSPALNHRFILTQNKFSREKPVIAIIFHSYLIVKLHTAYVKSAHPPS